VSVVAEVELSAVAMPASDARLSLARQDRQWTDPYSRPLPHPQ